MNRNVQPLINAKAKKELTRTRNVDVLSKLKSQATKGIRRMPRRHQPMKDAVSCEKLRGTASKY